MEPTDDDLRLYAACFDANGDHKELRHLRWQFLSNPVVEADPSAFFVDFALEPGGDRLAGLYATFPVRFQIGPHRVIGVQSLDTIVDQNHRGKGLFTRLARGTYDRLQERGIALLYGFPNSNSAPGFFGKLGLTRLGAAPFLFLPLRARYFLGRLGVPTRVTRWVPDWLPTRRRGPRLAPDEEVSTPRELGPEVDELWARFAEQVRVAVVRDRAYLSWRLDRPRGGYKVLAYRKGGELRGLTVVTLQHKHGGRIGYLMELLYVPGDHRAGEILLQAAVDELAAQGADVVLAWSLAHAPNRTAFKRAGFLPLPERIRPIELHVAFLPLAAPEDAALGNRENWYLSYLDSDTV